MPHPLDDDFVRPEGASEPQPHEPAATVNARRSWSPLYRLRPLIGATAALGLTEWVFMRFGWMAAGIVAVMVGVVCFILLMAGRWNAAARGGTVSFVSALAVFAVACAFIGPVPALAASGMLLLIYIVVAWKLKLRNLMILVALVAVVLSLALKLGSSALILIVLFLVPLAAASIYSSLFRAPAFEQDALVSILELTTRASLPLAPAVIAFGEMCGPRMLHRLAPLAARLKAGDSLDTALRGNRQVLPPESAILIQLGISENMLGPALEQAVAAQDARSHYPETRGSDIAYHFVVILAAIAAACYFTFFVGPRLLQISADFGVPFPPLSHKLLEIVTTPFSTLGGLKLEELLITLFAILCGACLIALIGWALWRQGTLPLAPGTWLKQRLETAAFLRGLSVGLEAQRPIPELIMQLVRSDISPRNRGKWTAVFDELLRGGPLALGLKKQRLVTPSEAALIDCAQRVGNLHWVLRMVAETIERRTSYRMQAFGYALRTLALLFVGGLVALVVLAYFMPLIQLIQYEVDSI